MIEIDQQQAYALATYSVRYALGRMSYAPGEVAAIVKQFAPYLTDGMLRVIIRDIREHAEFVRRVSPDHPAPYGPKDIECVWMDLKAHLEAVIAGPRDERFRH